MVLLAAGASFSGGWFAAKRGTMPTPEQKIPTGFTFQMPCEEHGSHTGTITGTSLVRVYDASRDDGEKAVFPENDLLDFFTAIGVTVK